MRLSEKPLRFRRRKARNPNLAGSLHLPAALLSPSLRFAPRTKVDGADFVDFFQCEACAERVCHKQHTLRARVGQFAADFRFVFAAWIEAAQAGFQTAQGFLETFLNRASHRHHFAHRFHLRGQTVVCGGEFFETQNAGFW